MLHSHRTGTCRYGDVVLRSQKRKADATFVLLQGPEVTVVTERFQSVGGVVSKIFDMIITVTVLQCLLEVSVHTCYITETHVSSFVC